MAKPQTIVITNFGGRLTRIINGDLNSGFAKFDTSWGYDPFTKPMNLTWLEQPTSIAGLSDVVMGGITRTDEPFSGTVQKAYLAGSTGKIYNVLVSAPLISGTALIDSVVGVTSVNSTFFYGAGMQFFGQNEKLYLGGDTKIVATGSVTSVGIFQTAGDSSTIGNTSFMGLLAPHPLAKFAGKLVFGNGPSIGVVDTTGTITSSVYTAVNYRGNQYSELFPPLQSDNVVRDLDATIDASYVDIGASNVAPELIAFPRPSNATHEWFDSSYADPGQGGIFSWNGVDKGITKAQFIPGGVTTAIQNFLQTQILFINDTFGTAVVGRDGTKLLTLPSNKSPVPNATTTNGNFVAWMSPEVVDDNRVASLYYFGSLDGENPAGLYRLLRQASPLSDGQIFQVPYNQIVNNAYKTINRSVSSIINASYGKHYFSTYSVSPTVTTSSTVGAYHLYRFLVNQTGVFPPLEGTYETQTQLFSKRVSLAQIRVYTEPTATGNGFQLDIIGADGAVVSNGTFTYSYAAGTDVTLLQGALQRINFDTAINTGYAFGVRVTNTGTANMIIKKIEVDYNESGK
jgi:hypothetical protein